MKAKEIYENIVIPLARDNAYETEELSKESKQLQDVSFQHIVYLSAQGIVDSLCSPKDYRNYLEKPISVRTLRKLIELLKKDFAYLT